MKELHVVGIGASAGGLESLQQFLEQLEPDTGMAFVIVQHLSPDYQSLMDQLLAKKTAMPIRVVNQQEKLKPNHIYLISKDYYLKVEKGRVAPIKRSSDVRNPAIDIMLSYLAKSYMQRSIAVILSGTGSDGSRGIRDIKENGGIVMVQEPSEAQFDGMPNSAMATGLADLVYPIEKIAQELNRIGYAANNIVRLAPDHDHQASDADREQLARIISYLRTNKQADFSNYRTPTLYRRLEKRLKITNTQTLTDYLEYLQMHPMEAQELINDFYIGVSSFFRDEHVWKHLESELIPALFKAKSDGEELRVWVAGCSSGEEVYSLGILLQQHIDQYLPTVDFKIFATDVDPRAISVASQGVYGSYISAQVPTILLDQYFTKVEGEYKISKLIRDKVIFTQHNLLTDPPFIRMDIVSCRNTLIYLNQPAQRNIFKKFIFSLKHGGFLVLGLSESLGEYSKYFTVFAPHLNVFKTLDPLPGTSLETDLPRLGQLTKRNYQNVPASSGSSHQPNFVSDYYAGVLVREHAPASIFYNTSFDIQYINGEVEPYLSFPKQYVKMNLLDLLEADQQLVLKRGTQQVREQKKSINLSSVSFGRTTNKQNQLVNLRFKEFWNDYLKQPTYLVEISPQQGTVAHTQPSELNSQELNELRIVKAELEEKDDHVRYLTEQLESNKEELQASNEELQASNEELQASNEELQSVNEELQTLNSELTQKIEEVTSAHADTDNLFASSEIPTLFLDENLRIRKFTPSAKTIFNLDDEDVGRNICHFTNRLHHPDQLITAIAEVIRYNQRQESEVSTTDDKFYIQRITPYQSRQGHTTGTVVLYLDVTELKQNIFKAQQYSSVVEGSLNEVYIARADNLNLQEVNQPALESLGRSLAEVLELSLEELVPAANKVAFQHKISLLQLNQAQQLQFETCFKRKDGSWYDVLLNVKMVEGIDGPLIVASGQNISELKQAETIIRENEERLRFVLGSTSEGLWDWMDISDPTKLYWSPKMYEILGLQANQFTPSFGALMERIHPEDHARVSRLIEQHLEQNQKYEVEMRIKHPEQGYQWYLTRGESMRDSQGKAYRMAGTLTKIQARKEAELAREKMVEELKTANDYLDNFVYAAAHDLRQPVSNLRMITDLASKKGPDEVALERINRSVDRLENTLKGLVQILEIQQSKTKETKKIHFEKLLSAVQLEVEPLLASNQSDWNVHFNVPAITYVQPYLESILRNLLSGAIRLHANSSPLKLTVETHSGISDREVILKVSNMVTDLNSNGNAGGVATDENSVKWNGQNFGLGWHLIKTMVEHNGGQVEVRSIPGQGAIFTVRLVAY